MKISYRYLATEVVLGILIVLAGFLALFAFFDMIGEVKNVGQGGYQLYHAAGFIILRLPGRVYEIMPVAVLIGTLYTLSILARHSEITVMRVSGMSTRQLFAVLAVVALFFSAIIFLIGEFVVAPSEQAAQRLRLKERGQTISQGLRSGVWVKDDRKFINVRTVLPNNRLHMVRIYEFDAQARLSSVTEAKEGVYVPPASWRLTEVVRTALDEDKSQVVHLPEIIWQSALNPDILNVLIVSPERMSLTHLSAYIQHLRENNQKTQRYEIALWKKIIYPLALLVMVALALPFGYTHNRVSGTSLKIFSGVMIGVLFHMLNGLFSNLGAINSWSPFLSAIAPSMLFMIAAFGAIFWVERR